MHEEVKKSHFNIVWNYINVLIFFFKYKKDLEI